MSLSPGRGEQLLTISREHASVLFEDDYDSEFAMTLSHARHWLHVFTEIKAELTNLLVQEMMECSETSPRADRRA